jgi:hypothetical protein
MPPFEIRLFDADHMLTDGPAEVSATLPLPTASEHTLLQALTVLERHTSPDAVADRAEGVDVLLRNVQQQLQAVVSLVESLVLAGDPRAKHLTGALTEPTDDPRLAQRVRNSLLTKRQVGSIEQRRTLVTLCVRSHYVVTRLRNALETR